MPRVTRSKEMAVSVEALYQAITDFEGYPEFLKEVVSAKPTMANAEAAEVGFELEIVKRFQYSLSFKMLPKQRVEWVLKESNFFKKNTGSWVLTPKGDDRVFAEYNIDLDFGFFVPKWVSKKLTEVNLPTMFDNFESRAKQLMNQ